MKTKRILLFLLAFSCLPLYKLRAFYIYRSREEEGLEGMKQADHLKFQRRGKKQV